MKNPFRYFNSSPDIIRRLCHELDRITDYAQQNIPSGSCAGSNAPRRESLITPPPMFGSCYEMSVGGELVVDGGMD